MVVVLALASALSYGLSDFVGGLVSRRTSPWAVAVLGQAASAVCVLVLALVLGGDPVAADWAWAALAGVGSGVGAGFLYRGLASGRMGVVAPVSAVGAALLPVLVGVAIGERPALLTWLGVICAFPAIWLVSRTEAATADQPDDGSRLDGPTSNGLVDGVLAGVGFGLLFAALDRVRDEAGFGPLAVTQAVAVVATAVLAAALAAAWVPGRASLPAVWAGVLSALANVFFLLATQTGLLAVAAVLTSLYPALTVLLAALVLREHIGRIQSVGLVLAVVAVGLVAAG